MLPLSSYREKMNTLLISTYEMGRQPFGLASPAAWLRRDGFDVRCLDLSIDALDPEAVQAAGLVAFYVPMHMGTRMTVPVINQVRQLNPEAHLCCYGLYAPVSADYLRRLGVDTILGGEFETSLVALAQRIEEAKRRRGEEARRHIPASPRLRISGSPLISPTALDYPHGQRTPLAFCQKTRPHWPPSLPFAWARLKLWLNFSLTPCSVGRISVIMELMGLLELSKTQARASLNFQTISAPRLRSTGLMRRLSTFSQGCGPVASAVFHPSSPDPRCMNPLLCWADW
jgi:hypothetical protein